MEKSSQYQKLLEASYKTIKNNYTLLKKNK